MAGLNGYALVYSPCLVCKQVIGYNPHLVPSLRVNGVKQPVCRNCLEIANRRREKNGDTPHPIMPGAYEPIREEEL